MARPEEQFRECAATRQSKPVAELIRFVVGPDNVLVPDIDARAEGRGVWVTADASSVAEAVKRRAFARSLKEPVSVPEDLVALTRLRLEQRLLGALGLARKAGQIATGATRVRSALDSGEARALLTATDAASDGRQKMLGALSAVARRSEIGISIPHFELLDSDQLGLALGIENVIHAALLNGPAAQSAINRAQRLARFIARTPEEKTKLDG